MKVRLIRDFLHHRSGEVLVLGVGDARRLLSLNVAVLCVEADSAPPPEIDMKTEEKTKEAVPPNDKMVRASTTKKRGRPKGSKNKNKKKKKKNRAVV